MMGKENTYEKCGKIFARKQQELKRFREEAGEGRQAGIQGQWQLESPAREYLEQGHCCLDTDCFIALKSGEREEYKKHFQKGGENHGMGF